MVGGEPDRPHQASRQGEEAPRSIIPQNPKINEMRQFRRFARNRRPGCRVSQHSPDGWLLRIGSPSPKTETAHGHAKQDANPRRQIAQSLSTGRSGHRLERRRRGPAAARRSPRARMTPLPSTQAEMPVLAATSSGLRFSTARKTPQRKCRSSIAVPQNQPSLVTFTSTSAGVLRSRDQSS